MRSKEDFLAFGAPLIGEEEIEEVVACLRSGWIGKGPRVDTLEREFAAYRESSYAVAVSSCTAALHLSLLSSDLNTGDEVITSPLTFCATANAIIHAGLVPVLADIDPVTQNIDPAQVEACITPRTRALLPVHFAGRPCDMDALVDIAQRYNLKIIEDCAHATEAQYRGQPLGTFGDFGCFSFYVTKNMTTAEGGMVLPRTVAGQERVKMLALHGLSRDAWNRFSSDGYNHYEVIDCGFKYNMTDLQAALGIHQLRRLETNLQRREILWDRYMAGLADLPVGLPAAPAEETRHARHLFTLLIDPDVCGMTRDEFMRGMNDCNIGLGVHYVGLPEQPYYQRQFGWKPADYPNAAKVSQQTVSLPFSARLTDRDAEDVIEAVGLTLGSFVTANTQRR